MPLLPGIGRRFVLLLNKHPVKAEIYLYKIFILSRSLLIFPLYDHAFLWATNFWNNLNEN